MVKIEQPTLFNDSTPQRDTTDPVLHTNKPRRDMLNEQGERLPEKGYSVAWYRWHGIEYILEGNV